MRRVVKKRPSVSETIVHGRTCIHLVNDGESDNNGPMYRVPCGKEISTEEIVSGKLTFGRQHQFLCTDHEYDVHYARRRYNESHTQRSTPSEDQGDRPEAGAV